MDWYTQPLTKEYADQRPDGDRGLVMGTNRPVNLVATDQRLFASEGR